MKKWIKAVAFSLVLILAIPVTVPQCDQMVVQAATKKPKLNVKNNKKTLYVGDNFKIKVTNYKDKFKWTSSNKKVATVDKNGVIKAKKAGIATISTTKDQYWVYCMVVVKNKSVDKKPTDNKPVDNTPKFNAEEAKSKITFTPVETCKNLFEVSSTYEIPTLATVDYKVIDSEGITIEKSQKFVIAVPWDKTYIWYPANYDGCTVNTTIEYKDGSEAYSTGKLTKEYWDKTNNAIQIYKYEPKKIIEDFYCYDIYVKNISDQKFIASNTFNMCVYDKNGNIIGFWDNVYIPQMDAGEIVKLNQPTSSTIINHNDVYEFRLHIKR